MIRTLRFGTLAVLMACVVLATVNPVRGDDEEEKRKMEAAEKLAKIKKAGAALEDLVAGKAKAEDIVKAHTMEYVMYNFKPNNKGGLGQGDGFEVRIRKLASAKKLMTPAEIAAEEKELIKLAEVSHAIGLLVDKYPLPKKEKDKDPRDWVKFNTEMKDSAKSFIEAVKAKKPEDIKKFGGQLNGSCVNCHRVFRDAL